MPYRKTTFEQERQILAMYAETNCTRLVADTFCIPLHRVGTCLDRHGVARSRKKMNACLQHDVTVREMAAQGATLNAIGLRVGTKGEAVRAYLEENGIPFVLHKCKMEHNSRWKGGRRIEDGYVMIKEWNHPHCNRHGYVREHRLVIERVLGRYLLPTEVVHHKGDKTDNSPDQLVLYGSNADHLAETLQRQVPKWTEEGFARMKAPRPHARGPRHKSTPSASEAHGGQ